MLFWGHASVFWLWYSLASAMEGHRDEDRASCLAEMEAEARRKAEEAFDEVLSVGYVVAGRVNYADDERMHLSYAFWTAEEGGKLKVKSDSVGFEADEDGAMSGW